MHRASQRLPNLGPKLSLDIKRTGTAGGLLFSYTDEWFKRTWNTMDMEKPEERRPLWQNALTNEEQFGIVAAEAGKKAAVTVDGSDKEWTRTQSQQIYEGGGTVKEVRAIHDANWLYLLVRRDGDSPFQLGRVTVSGGKGFVELRLPWAMLTFTDPSSHQVWVPRGDGSVDTLAVGRLGIQVAPAGQASVSTHGYGWDDWNRLDYHERRKAGWPTVQRSMLRLATR